MRLFRGPSLVAAELARALRGPSWRRRFLPTLCWAHVADGFDTCIQIFNYLPFLGQSRAACASLEIQLFSEDGRPVAFWQDVLKAGESRFVSVRDLVGTHASFQGSATVRLWPLNGVDSLVSRPVWTTEFFTRYWDPRGRGASIVHNLQAISYVSFQVGSAPMTSPVWLDDNRDTSLILFNTYWTIMPLSREVASPRIRVTNSTGASRVWEFPGPPIRPRGSRVVRLKELPGLVEFLDGKWGGVQVEGRNVPKRILVWVTDNESGDFNIHHN